MSAIFVNPRPPIFEVPDDQRIWIVRAESGYYLPHFLKASVVAIGHIDLLNLANDKPGPFFFETEIESDLVKAMLEEKIGAWSISSKVEQVRNFVCAIKAGDIVLTPMPRNEIVRVGRIIGPAYLDSTSIEVTNQLGEIIPFEYSLRREVVWGPEIRGDDVPIQVLQSLRARQTVFNIDRHWESLYHALLPMFIRSGSFYMSFKVEQENKVRNASVATFLSFLTDLEAMLSFQAPAWDETEFMLHFIALHEADLLRLSTKAQFQSPGSINIALEMIKSNEHVFLAYVTYSFLFGNKFFGIDGVVDLQTRQKLTMFSCQGGLSEAVPLQLHISNFSRRTSTRGL